MRKAFALAAVLAGLGTIGCASTTPGHDYAADPDHPPPLATNTKPVARAGDVDPAKLPPAQTRVSADDIDETNFPDAARKLASELKFDERPLSQAK